mmetsp:Transcript_5953/g.23531  ORF Transcript_5953/g.23531 Transcript_5953/m.23531 type:complete len:239 (-) Transcript_5953:10489-11205(-)
MPGSRRSARSVPPNSCTILAEMTRPRPRPSPGGLVVKKGSNRRGRLASAMPAPVSCTCTRTRCPPSSAAARTRRQRRASCCIASMALPNRLTSTCSSRLASARTRSPAGTSTSTCSASARLRCSSSSRALRTPSSRAVLPMGCSSALRAKLLSWRVIWLMRSTMSSMICRLAVTASVRPASSSRIELRARARSAVSGWLTSCDRPADICPSTASLLACSSSPSVCRRWAIWVLSASLV